MSQHSPHWDSLYETASAQEGHFSTAQAAKAGYSPQLLAKYLRNGKVRRVRRGVYRLVHFPPGEHEDLMVLWLWSSQKAVFSHETALALHTLSDAMPSRIHFTLPETWSDRRLRTPGGTAVHYGHVPKEERRWVGSVQMTNVARTLQDCASANTSPELVSKALSQALHRGLVTRAGAAPVRKYLAQFGSRATR